MTNVFTIKAAHNHAYDAIKALIPFFAGETNEATLLQIHAAPDDGLAARVEISGDAMVSISKEEAFGAIVAGVLLAANAATPKQDILWRDVADYFKRNVAGFDSNKNQSTFCAGVALGTAWCDGEKLFAQTYQWAALTGTASNDKRKLGQSSKWGDTPLSGTALRKIMATAKKDKAAKDEAAAGDRVASAGQSDAGKESREGAGGPVAVTESAREARHAARLLNVLGTHRVMGMDENVRRAQVDKGLVEVLLDMGVTDDHISEAMPYAEKHD